MIEVWAPRAPRVRVRRPGAADIDLVPAPLHDDAVREGWWTGDLELRDGDEYAFVLGDGEAAIADPRSRRQPRGVHEASALFDPMAFAWTDAAWTGRQLAGGLIYELHVGTFTPEGTLDAAIGRLGHLVELGVTHVELLPVNGFNGTWNWGYDGVLWYTVHEAYGGPAAYQRFVDAAHGSGLAVIQDVVYNHLGPSGNHLPEFGPYLRDAERNTWGSSIDLDQPEVRAYIVDNALMWLDDYHVDGLRLDAVHALQDASPTHILQELTERVDALSAHLGRPLTLIAESDLNDPKLILPREAGGYGLTAQWSDDWHHAVHVALTGETSGYYADFADPHALIKVSTQGFFHDGTRSSFRGREHGHPIPREVPAWRLVTFAQDHDQIGNRAAGDRLSQSLPYGRLAVAAVLTLTTPGTPMLFQGEEWAASTPWQFFTSHPEPELGEATAAGRIAEFARMGWDESTVPDPQDPETFRRSKLDWSEADAGDHARMLDLYRALARLRRDRPELTDPSWPSSAATGSSGSAGAAHRTFELVRGDVRVIANLGAEPHEVRVGEADAVLLATDGQIAVRTVEYELDPDPDDEGRVTLTERVVVLPPDTAVIVGPPR
jgi:maltooligosyltrehalose trehalohydrolase